MAAAEELASAGWEREMTLAATRAGATRRRVRGGDSQSALAGSAAQVTALHKPLLRVHGTEAGVRCISRGELNVPLSKELGEVIH